jgi:hypothetical protein
MKWIKNYFEKSKKQFPEEANDPKTILAQKRWFWLVYTPLPRRRKCVMIRGLKIDAALGLRHCTYPFIFD